MNRRISVGVAMAAAVAALTIVAVAGAGGAPQSATLTGAAEIPGPGDPDGSGAASLRLNPGQEEICYELTVSDIAPAAAAHIHRGAVSVAGPVVVPLIPPTDGSSSACASVDRDLVLEILIDPAAFYVNVHNADYPAGAIRGQLSQP
jgi:CHRD domain